MTSSCALATPVSGLDRAVGNWFADGSVINYRDLVLATGSRPKPLDITGGDHPELIFVRDLDSGERLRALAGQSGTRVVVIGSGFIGCEAAASLASRGARGDVGAQRRSSAHRPARGRGRARIGGWLTEHGVTRRTATRVSGLKRRGDALAGLARRRLGVSADEVVCGAGVEPNVELAEQAGLPLDNGGILTGPDLHTVDPHIFAVGDIAYALNATAGRRLRVEHWGDADRHGTFAGTAAAGGVDRWADAPGFWSGIGHRTLKYSAWGDGYDEAMLVETDTSWVVWYRRGQELCGVLAVEDDDAYERGRQLLEARAPFAEAVRSGPDGR